MRRNKANKKAMKLREIIYSDLYRYYGRADLWTLLKAFVPGNEYQYLFWMRVCRWADERSWIWIGLKIFSWLLLRRYMFKYGIIISYKTEIGPGFYVGHFGGIVISYKARIGKNCNISQGVTIGQSYRGERRGTPTLGDGVFVGPGAKLFGNIKVGNNVAVGANCVVTRDVPDNAVIIGVPGKVISFKGAHEFICNTGWENNS
jgi:serine O-acetyltransferase